MKRGLSGLGRDTQVETAWRIHAAHVAWIESVDTKAGFAFALQSAALTLALFLASDGQSRVVSDADRAAVALGVSAIMAGAAFSAMVITPRLRAGDLLQESRTDHIYFGHARLWAPRDLERSLRRRDPIPQLSRQIVALAEIAWVKHRRVRASIVVSVAGGGWLTSYATYVVLR